MSGFSPPWLALREGADLAARNKTVEAALIAHFAHAPAMQLVDLACGTGANIRALALHLPPDRQSWRLVDHDRDLLTAARDQLAGWADKAAPNGEALILTKGDKTLEVSFLACDLARYIAAAFAGPVDLVLTSAFFDLVSARWIERCAAMLAERGLPLFATLTYTGEEIWLPSHPLDAAVLSAFHSHQHRDKGFGPAAGPSAFDDLNHWLAAHRYRLVTGDSSWQLGASDGELVAELAEGIAAAARETDIIDEASLSGWLASRRAARARIAHADLFAAPPSG